LLQIRKRPQNRRSCCNKSEGGPRTGEELLANRNKIPTLQRSYVLQQVRTRSHHYNAVIAANENKVPEQEWSYCSKTGTVSQT
jgi:hypothetical protein